MNKNTFLFVLVLACIAIICILGTFVVQERSRNHLLTHSVYQTQKEGNSLKAEAVQLTIERQIQNDERIISQRVQQMEMGQPSASETVVVKANSK